MDWFRQHAWIDSSKIAAVGCIGAALLWLAISAKPARASDDAYCEQVKARAASDAALLMAPRLLLQELRYPKNGQVDLDGSTGRGFQFRTGLSFSPVEFFKGLAVLDAGEAACSEHQARQSLHERLSHAREYARLAALRVQAAFLNEHRAEWRVIVSRAADRLTRRVITLVDFTRLRQLIDGLERKLVQVEGGLAELQLRLPAKTEQRTLDGLIERYAAESARFERVTAESRALDVWQVRVTGGVIAQSPVDWFGGAELAFSFGGLVRPRYEHRYERARAQELRDADYELPAQVRELRAQSRLALEQARRELEISERTIATVTSARQVLEKLEAEDVAHARDTLSVESFSAEAEAVFLLQLVEDLESASE